VWIRFVLVPGLTDDVDNVERSRVRRVAQRDPPGHRHPRRGAALPPDGPRQVGRARARLPPRRHRAALSRTHRPRAEQFRAHGLTTY
jgi:hypothetical protein